MNHCYRAPGALFFIKESLQEKVQLDAASDVVVIP